MSGFATSRAGRQRSVRAQKRRLRLRPFGTVFALAGLWSSSIALATSPIPPVRPFPAVSLASAPSHGSAISLQTIIDRIVAVVGDQVITLSDVRMARAFGLVSVTPASAAVSAAGAVPGTQASADSQMSSGAPAGSGTVSSGAGVSGSEGLTESQIIERLVERELMRAEVERFGAGEPPAGQVEARVEAARARFASPDAFRAALEANGLSEARFRAWIADDLRIEQYIEQRFGASAQPTDEEVLQYYQSREREFAVDGRPRPFDEVREMVRRRLGASRRQAMVDDWVAGLRRRTAVALKTID